MAECDVGRGSVSRLWYDRDCVIIMTAVRRCCHDDTATSWWSRVEYSFSVVIMVTSRGMTSRNHATLQNFQASRVSEALDLFGEMLERGHKPNRIAVNSMLAACAKDAPTFWRHAKAIFEVGSGETKVPIVASETVERDAMLQTAHCLILFFFYSVYH